MFKPIRKDIDKKPVQPEEHFETEQAGEDGWG
jgi:hypothetical protein